MFSVYLNCCPQMTEDCKRYELRTVDETLIKAGQKLLGFTRNMINTLEAVAKSRELIIWLRDSIKSNFI